MSRSVSMGIMVGVPRTAKLTLQPRWIMMVAVCCAQQAAADMAYAMLDPGRFAARMHLLRRDDDDDDDPGDTGGPTEPPESSYGQEPGMPWHHAVAFLAAVGFILAFMVLLALVLQCANPPRMEARHYGQPEWQNQRMRSQRRVSQNPRPRPPSGRPQLGSSPSQVGLLDQVQPQPVSSRRSLREGHRSRQLPVPPQHRVNGEPAPYMGIQMPPAVRGQPLQDGYSDYTTTKHAGPSRPARSLPAPPQDYGAPLMDSMTPYHDYVGPQGYAEASPFESHETLNQPSVKAPSRSSRGYVPLPEPPVQMSHFYTEYAHPQQSYYDNGYHQHDAGSYDTGRGLRHQNSTRSRRSGGLERTNSQLSRVESIGAGDRRHSRRLPDTPNKPRMTTAERLQALRSATQDVTYAGEFPPHDASYPAQEEQDFYTMDTMQYPIRDEHRYANHYGGARSTYSSGGSKPTYRRYNPI